MYELFSVFLFVLLRSMACGSASFVSLVKRSLLKMWKHRPQPKTPESKSTFLQIYNQQNCSSLLSELNMKKYLHFQLIMSFPAEKYTQLIMSDTVTTFSLTYACINAFILKFIFLKSKVSTVDSCICAILISQCLKITLENIMGQHDLTR